MYICTYVNADAIGGADEHADADARWWYANAHAGGGQRKGSWNVAPGWEATFRLHFSNGHFNDVAAYGKKWIKIFPVIFIAFSVQLKQQLTTMMMSAMLPRNAGLGLGQAPRCQGRAGRGRADAEGLARTPDRHDPGFEPLLVFPWSFYIRTLINLCYYHIMWIKSRPCKDARPAQSWIWAAFSFSLIFLYPYLNQSLFLPYYVN